MLLCFLLMTTDCDSCLRPPQFSILTISSAFFDKVMGAVSLRGAGVSHHLATHLPAYVRCSYFLVLCTAAKTDVQLPVMSMTVGAEESELSAVRSCYLVAQGRCLRWRWTRASQLREKEWETSRRRGSFGLGSDCGVSMVGEMLGWLLRCRW